MWVGFIIVLFDVQNIENVSSHVCVCVCVMCRVTTQGLPPPICHSLSHSSELAPQLEVLWLFKTHPYSHMADPDFTMLEL